MMKFLRMTAFELPFGRRYFKEKRRDRDGRNFSILRFLQLNFNSAS